MLYTFCTQTDPGRIRANNEDAVAFDEANHLCVLADGMGGYNAGEIASGMATAFITSELARWLAEVGKQATTKDIARALEMCVSNANLAVYNAANANPQYDGMGTTLVVGVFRDETLILGHIGDSRCYRLRAGVLSQLTKDHSVLQEQIDAGLITPAQALSSPHKNLVTRAVGVDTQTMLECHEHPVQAGDLFLMCSDGLSDMVIDPHIARTLDGPDPLEKKAARLIALANERGGRDNISVVLIQAGASAEKRGLIARWLGQ